MNDPLLQVVQYGWPGVLALILYWGGKLANKLVESHIETMKAMVQTLTKVDTKTDSILTHVRRSDCGEEFSDTERPTGR